jgi:hypothetical protein
MNTQQSFFILASLCIETPVLFILSRFCLQQPVFRFLHVCFRFIFSGIIIIMGFSRSFKFVLDLSLEAI